MFNVARSWYAASRSAVLVYIDFELRVPMVGRAIIPDAWQLEDARLAGHREDGIWTDGYLSRMEQSRRAERKGGLRRLYRAYS